MASKALKGLTIKIGADTSDLFESLDKVDKKGRSLSSELGQINKALKLDPSNTELLAQKQQVLADAISNTEEKLGTLKDAEKQVQEQFERGEVSEAQVRALRREIIETERKLDKYKKASKETADAVEELGRESDDAAEDIEDLGDESKDTEDATEDLDDAANDLAAGGLAALAAAAVAAVTAIVALAEESREYRTEMAKLDTAFTNVGHSSEAATKTYEALQSVVGETEQAVEAANHLAKLASSEEELAEWTEILTGVYGTFGASLSIESLAEAANETIRAGTVTGAFADSLNWAAAEGETFGVTMKENIEFTELDKKALDQLTDAQREEYEARKAQYDEIEAYNKKVEEAATAEDMFNIALENCADAQERQQLITKTLTSLYGSAATQFKTTNKEVIRANQATEKWNKATAKIGKTVEPVVTDIKELGVTLLDDVEEPLENIADYIRTDVLPAIKNISSWVKSNGPLIKGAVVGVTTAFIAYKGAVVAATIAEKGLKGAIVATTVAQKALILVQSATPWGLIATAVAALTTALIAYTVATKKAEKPVETLTEAEKDLLEASQEAAEAFKEQQKATEATMKGILSEMDYVTDLADELEHLADESGKVDESNQARADFIIGELNRALGLEIEMTDGVIQNYADLKANIDEVIKSKRANALMEAYNADYLAAIKGETEAFNGLTLAQKDYEAQQGKVAEAQAAYDDTYNKYLEALDSGQLKEAQYWQSVLIGKDSALQQEKKILDEKKAAYDGALSNYEAHYNTVADYEEAQTAILEGNYDRAEEILMQKGLTYEQFAGKVDKETGKTLDILYKEAVDAGIAAQRTRENFEKGVEGYTEDMAQEAELGYLKALGAFSSAYADAELVGEDLGDGLSDGMETKRSSLISKAKSLVTSIISAMREEGDTHSPSRKTMDFAEDMGAGAEIGLEKSTKGVKRAATGQAEAILNAYREQEITAQRALRNVADQQAARHTAGQMTAATANSPMLERILHTLEQGQVLILDGDALVGATANRMDTALGRRRDLAAKGAI